MSDTRTYILEVAFKLFFSKGFKEVTMSELVKASGLSKGAFYHYFSSKEELYDQTIEIFFLEPMKNFELEFKESLTLRQNIVNLFKRFSALSEKIIHLDTDDHKGIGNYLLYIQRAFKNAEFREKMLKFNHVYNHHLTSWIQNSQTRGEISDKLDPQVLALHLASLMKGYLTLHSLMKHDELYIEAFTKIINQFFDQIEVKDYEFTTKSSHQA